MTDRRCKLTKSRFYIHSTQGGEAGSAFVVVDRTIGNVLLLVINRSNVRSVPFKSNPLQIITITKSNSCEGSY